MTSQEFNEYLVKALTNRTRGMIEALADIGERHSTLNLIKQAVIFTGHN